MYLFVFRSKFIGNKVAEMILSCHRFGFHVRRNENELSTFQFLDIELENKGEGKLG